MVATKQQIRTLAWALVGCAAVSTAACERVRQFVHNQTAPPQPAAPPAPAAAPTVPLPPPAVAPVAVVPPPVAPPAAATAAALAPAVAAPLPAPPAPTKTPQAPAERVRRVLGEAGVTATAVSVAGATLRVTLEASSYADAGASLLGHWAVCFGIAAPLWPGDVQVLNTVGGVDALAVTASHADIAALADGSLDGPGFLAGLRYQKLVDWAPEATPPAPQAHPTWRPPAHRRPAPGRPVGGNAGPAVRPQQGNHR